MPNSTQGRVEIGRTYGPEVDSISGVCIFGTIGILERSKSSAYDLIFSSIFSIFSAMFKLGSNSSGLSTSTKLKL